MLLNYYYVTGIDSEESTTDTTKSPVAKQHMMICATTEISSLISALNTAAIPLVISDSGTVGGDSPAPLIEALNCLLINQSMATRYVSVRTIIYIHVIYIYIYIMLYSLFRCY